MFRFPLAQTRFLNAASVGDHVEKHSRPAQMSPLILRQEIALRLGALPPYEPLCSLLEYGNRTRRCGFSLRRKRRSKRTAFRAVMPDFLFAFLGHVINFIVFEQTHFGI